MKQPTNSRKAVVPAPAPPQEMLRSSITLPGVLADFAYQRAAGPEWCGNLSAYVRTLIVRDYEKHKGQLAS